MAARRFHLNNGFSPFQAFSSARSALQVKWTFGQLTLSLWRECWLIAVLAYT
jgi:hypothetical protein